MNLSLLKLLAVVIVLVLHCAGSFLTQLVVVVSAQNQYPPGFYTAWTFGRIWWANDSSLYPFPVGSFDNSGTAFCMLSVGGGSMNLTGLGVDMMVKSSTNATTNQAHYFGAYLFEFASAGQLPTDLNKLMLPPPLHKAARTKNFTTESWTNASAIYQENIFEISDPSKTYIMWLIKLTEPDWNRRFPEPNFCTFVSFSLTRQLPSSKNGPLHSFLHSSEQKEEKIPVHIPKYQDSTLDEIFSSSSSSSSSSPYSRRIQFLGDSITAGYCNNCIMNPDDGPNGTTIPTSYANESFVKTWGYLLAAELEAEFHTIAWSGIGMVQNYNNTGHLHFPEIFLRTCASAFRDDEKCGAWIFPPHQNTSKTTQPFLPQVVVMNLGTNDFSVMNETTNATEWNETAKIYVKAYKGVVTDLALYYGMALRATVQQPLHLFLACGPMDHSYCKLLRQIDAWWKGDDSALRKSVDITILDFPTLADNVTDCSHPNAEGDRIMMEEIVSTIRDKSGWKK